jgi:hypothetical protein
MEGVLCCTDKLAALEKELSLDGSACPSAATERIFVEDWCSIKGSQSRKYHMRGCPNYDSMTNVVKWFCSEDEARAEGYIKAGDHKMRFLQGTELGRAAPTHACGVPWAPARVARIGFLGLAPASTFATRVDASRMPALRPRARLIAVRRRARYAAGAASVASTPRAARTLD